METEEQRAAQPRPYRFRFLPPSCHGHSCQCPAGSAYRSAEIDNQMVFLQTHQENLDDLGSHELTDSVRFWGCFRRPATMRPSSIIRTPRLSLWVPAP